MTPYETIRLRAAALLYFPAEPADHSNPRIWWQADPERRAARPEHRKRRGVRHEALFDRAEMEGLRRRPVVAGCVKWEAA
ncbi:hypothetical protein FE391_20405 [Nonomuraea sp. KC401]|nr:hypothetical protein FE391_20405 [Nonomuraea sp. KC401]